MSSSMAIPATSIISLSRRLRNSSETNTSCSYSCNLHHLIWRIPRASNRMKLAVRRGVSAAACHSGGAGSKLPRELFLLSFAGSIISSSRRAASSGRSPLASLSSLFAVPSGPGGGGDGLGVGNGGGDGDSGSNGGGTDTNSIAGQSEDVSNLGSDVIILDVGGMSCGGCAASVKRILESLPQVSSANVNLATETAVVWATSEAKDSRDWQQDLGLKLASHLSTCGFKSNLRGRKHSVEGDSQS